MESLADILTLPGPRMAPHGVQPLDVQDVTARAHAGLPPATDDGARRLAALRSYHVLDTPREQALDDIVELAARICDTPIALINLLDDRRQWCKARIGCELTETPLEEALCAYVLHQTEPLIVPDTTQDPRFAEHQSVAREGGVRFYAGAPLITPAGEVLGTLCVVDRVPHQMTGAQAQTLRVLGRQVMTHFELRRQTLELAKQEGLLTAIFNAEPEGVSLLGLDGTVRMINPAGLKILGAGSPEQITERSIVSMVAQEHRVTFQELIHRVFHGESDRMEFRLIGLNGIERWVEIHAVPLRDERGQITDFLSIARDVTDRQRAEEALRESEASLAAAQARAHLGSWEWDLRTGEGRWSAEMLSLHGLPAGSATPRYPEFVELAHPEDRASLRQLRAEVMKSNEPFSQEYRTDPARGTMRHLCATVDVIRDPGGQPIRLVGTTLDVTERKCSEARLRRLIDSNAQGVYFWNVCGRVLSGNDAFLNIVGRTRAELEAGAINWVAMTAPEDAAVDERVLRELAEKGVCAPFEKEYILPDGSRVPVLLAAAMFEDNPEEGVCFVFDLTERKKLEQQFLRSQRMESIGTLAGGIAHDLNNALGPIIMSLDILKMKFEDQESQELLEIIDTCARRGSDMVRQVLSFARGMEGSRVEVQVKHVLNDIEQMARETFPKDIRIVSSVPNGLWTVQGDPTQIHQVLLNLCVNARDAMPGGGNLALGADNMTLDAQYAGLDPDARPGPYLLIEVEDSGMGMSPDVVEKIFDPFFTTKEVGKGTGLGLSTSLAIVKSHGGFIRVYSEPGRGTKFKVYLPAQTSVSTHVETKKAVEMPRGNGETILLVDDELAVRQITQQTLHAFGYRVVTAEDGTEAVKIFAGRHQEIAVVLTDMMMPLMDGPTTIQILRKIDPGVRVIAASGLAAESHIAQVTRLGIKHFLPKPYTASALLNALRQTLGADPPPA